MMVPFFTYLRRLATGGYLLKQIRVTLPLILSLHDVWRMCGQATFLRSVPLVFFFCGTCDEEANGV